MTAILQWFCQSSEQQKVFRALIAVAIGGCACFGGGFGCHSSQKSAQEAVNRELASRDQANAASMALYGQARTLYHQQKSADAAIKLTEAIRTDNRNLYAWMLLGQIELERENYFESAAAFDEARRLAPGQYEPAYNLGIVLEASGKLSDAAQCYEAALKLSPGQLNVIENLARIYIRLRVEPDKTRSLIAQALREETRPEWRQWLGLQSVRLELSEGRERNEPAPTTNPENLLTPHPTSIP